MPDSTTKTGYSPFEAVKSISDSGITEKTENTLNYEMLLAEVRGKITQNHAVELGRTIDSENGASTLRTLIDKYVCTSSSLHNIGNTAEIAERIYNDMAGYSVLTEPLHDSTVEEINVNGTREGSIEITRGGGTTFPAMKFNSPEAAADTIRKMVLAGGLGSLDGQNPMIDSYIGGGTRISAMTYPIVREEDGVVASIRRQSKRTVSTKELIESGTATSEILAFVVLCVLNGVSVGLVGGMSSGKTTDITYLLNNYILHNTDFNNRIYIIEDTREIQLIDYDTAHNRPARVIYTNVVRGLKSMRDLVKASLRYNPRIIVPAECRDGAAFDVVDAGNTGQTIVTSLHAASAEGAYARLLSLCEMADSGLGENSLMEYIVTALPIMVFKEQQKDGTRRYAEIFEATGHSGGKVEGHLLFRYIKDSFDYDEHGKVKKVHGHFEKVNDISEKLRRKMINNGGADVGEALDRIFSESLHCETNQKKEDITQ